MRFRDKSFTEEHSQAKIRLLDKYIRTYLNIVVNDKYTNKIFLFDLFCGPGRYEDGREGSPIVLINAVRDIYFVNQELGKNICKIDLYFNDADQNKIKRLREIIESEKLYDNNIGNIKYGTHEYLEIMPKVKEFINKLNNQKVFIFIDPSGYKYIRASHIRVLLENKKTEVLLFLPTQFMYRFDEGGTPQALIDIYEELVSDSEREPSKSVYHYIEQFSDALRSYLGNEYFIDTFLIEKDSRTVFCLFFFSSHIRGFEKMLEVKWDLDEDEGRGFSYEKTGDLFAKEKLIEFEVKLSKYLIDYRTNAEIYYFTLREGFLPKHTYEILKKMENEDKIVSLIPKRKNAFYISYKNYRESPERIKIKLGQ